MRAVVIEDFNGSIELVRDPDTCDVLVSLGLKIQCLQRPTVSLRLKSYSMRIFTNAN